jgi:branched-chain amino acid transport system permease protein
MIPRPLRLVAWAVTAVVLVALPFGFPAFRVEQFIGWMSVAVAAAGLNLLTGYNGQISVGHGALYGIGAYTVALLVTDASWPLVPTVGAAAVVCFAVGVVVGLPALRIKGLYLALVTLAVAALFPLALEEFSSFTGGGSGLALTSPQLYRGRLRDRTVQWVSPTDRLAPDQWKYFIFLAVTVVVFVLAANLVKSRTGRSLVAIRDNDVAAEVSGIDVSRTKVLTFGISAAIAGIGGAMYALNNGRVNPTSFTLTLSIYFLVAVVVGGASTVIGPAIGAVVYGLFIDVLAPELPERLKAATPLILGILLILLMLTAPGGVVGIVNSFSARIAARRHGSGGTGQNEADRDTEPAQPSATSSAQPGGTQP